MKIICESCGTIFKSEIVRGKSSCPVCGASFENDCAVGTNAESTISAEEEHPGWITWYYYGYKSDNGKTACLEDKPIDLTQHGDVFFLIKEFKAPPESECGLDEVKRILRTYVPDAFVYKQVSEDVVRCPRCRSTEIQLVPRKFSLLTGFATNKFDRVCVRCKKRF